MGFDAWFFARQDWADEETEEKAGNKEWIHYPNGNRLGKDVSIFTHKMSGSHLYHGPMTFDITYETPPFISNENSKTFDAKLLGDQLAQIFRERASNYSTNEVFIQWGGDFLFMNAFYNFANLDRMIEYKNKHYSDEFHLRYSTPSDYIDAVKKYNKTWATREYDLFPYSSDPQNFWTGYFTSRANYKGYIRRGSHETHASNQLYAVQVLSQSASESEIEKILTAKYTMLDVMGINQHHDAVSGTSR